MVEIATTIYEVNSMLLSFCCVSKSAMCLQLMQSGSVSLWGPALFLFSIPYITSGYEPRPRTYRAEAISLK
jgi:hypothetical protein